MRSSSLYRKYNEDVPQYLRNRPRRLIDDMRKKMMSLEASVVAGVQMKSDGVFLVPARGTRPYHEVVFGDASTCCSCTCLSFQRTQLLCTHFCAVFRALPEWSFERVSPVYTQCPLLVLDEDMLHIGTSSSSQQTNIAASVPKLTSPDIAKVLKSERQKARLLLRNLFEITYKVNDVNMLQKIVKRLEPIHKELSDCLSTQLLTRDPTATDSTLPQTDNGNRKHKLEFKRSMLPEKKRAPETSPQVNVLEVHVIDGSKMDEMTASGPTFTV